MADIDQWRYLILDDNGIEDILYAENIDKTVMASISDMHSSEANKNEFNIVENN